MSNFPFGETVTRIRPTPRDQLGDPGGTPDETDIDGCAVWPTGTTEQASGQDTVSDQLTLLAPVGSDIKATDQIRRQGQPYDVDGQPATFTSPFTGLNPGVVVQLRKTTG